MRGLSRQLARGERGQVLPLLGIMLIAMLAVVVVVVDLGFIFGQRRFDQNGADAAALAAGRLLANGASPMSYEGGIYSVYFSVPEREVYYAARRYAGVEPGDPKDYPIDPRGEQTGANQNPLLADRNRVSVTLEYFNGVEWCYSPSMEMPPGGWPRPGVSTCSGLDQLEFEGDMVYLPPKPTPGQPYRIRVTVSSTTQSFFASVLHELTGMFGDITPAATADEAVAACLPAADSGNTTCAQAVVRINGAASQVSSGPLLPVTTGSCQIEQGYVGDLGFPMFPLWTSNPEDCGASLGGWKNIVDFSSARTWCDRSDPDYTAYNKLLPTGFEKYLDNTGLDPTKPGDAKKFCLTEDDATLPKGNSLPDTWDRRNTGNPLDPDGYDPDNPALAKVFMADPDYLGTGDENLDVAYWIASGGFGGRIYGNPEDGNKVPTYEGDSPSQPADGGQNFAIAFYCDNSATASDCPGLDDKLKKAGGEAPKSYFFAKDKISSYGTSENPAVCGDWIGQWGQRNGVLIGCRDAKIPIWHKDELEWADESKGEWSNEPVGGGGPNRLRIVGFYNMRLYCEFDKNSGLCTRAPGSVIGNYSNSDVWGYFLSEIVGTVPDDDLEDTPTIYGNVARLER